MISNERCHLEVLAEENNLPFLSVRPDLITFNSKYFTDPVFRKFADISDIVDKNRQIEAVIRFITKVCSSCDECVSQIIATHPRIEIKRIGYNYQPDVPLFEARVIRSKKEQHRGTVCLVEDHKPLLDYMGEYLADRGFRTVVVYVPPGSGVVSDMENRLLA